MDSVLAILHILGPVVLCAGAGWAWSRFGRPCDTASITQILVYVAVPCLIVSTLTRLDIDPAEILAMLAAAAAAHVFFFVAGCFFLRMANLPIGPYLGPLALGNTGNAGLPVCMLAYGERGLALGLGFMLVNTICIFTLGMWLPTGKRSLRPVATTPVPYAVGLGLALLFLDHKPPQLIAESLKIMGDMAIPLMLLALGLGLARIRLNKADTGLALALASTKILITSAVAFAMYYILEWMGMDGVFRGVFVLQCLMPIAVFMYLFAEMHEAKAEQVAGAVMASTLLSLAVLPAALGILL